MKLAVDIAFLSQAEAYLLVDKLRFVYCRSSSVLRLLYRYHDDKGPIDRVYLDIDGIK